MRPLYIFDLDGTIALIDHRRHLVEGGTKDWAAFYAACDQDTPNVPVINTLHLLRRMGADVWIWSGRSDEVRDKTERWLWEHVRFPDVVASLRMRKHDDYTKDADLKRMWWAATEHNDRKRLVATFDDRDQVVAMWREHGVACFQVAPGGF